MLGYLYDIGELGCLVMAAEDRSLREDHLPRELEDKLSECLWWVLVLADRLGVDINKAFTTKMNTLISNSQRVWRKATRSPSHALPRL